MFARFERVQACVERVCSVVAATALLLMMLIVTLDVCMRYFAGKPLTWSYDFVSLYLTVSLFYLTLARTLAEEGHIRVDLLHRHMSARSIRLWEVVNSLLAAALFALIGVLGYLQTVSQFSGHDVIASSVNWPTWLSTVFVPIGSASIVMRLLLIAFGHAATLWTGRELIPLPAMPDSEERMQVAD
jgi:TRAP-type C4-dicarboxylate transport system permease small subunit